MYRNLKIPDRTVVSLRPSGEKHQGGAEQSTHLTQEAKSAPGRSLAKKLGRFGPSDLALSPGIGRSWRFLITLNIPEHEHCPYSASGTVNRPDDQRYRGR
jgi:hypothetical protein